MFFYNDVVLSVLKFALKYTINEQFQNFHLVWSGPAANAGLAVANR